MSFHLFNLFRSTPCSPSTDAGIVDYCGCFDFESGRFAPKPPIVVPSSPRASASITTSIFNQSPLTPVTHKPYFTRSGEHSSAAFKEKHVSIKELDTMYAGWKKLDQLEFDEQQQKQQKSKKDRGGSDDDDSQGEQKGATPATSTSTTTIPTRSRGGGGTPTAPPPSKNRPIRIVLISDTHQYHDHITVPDGDVLLHAGDILLSDRFNIGAVSTIYLTQFLAWFNKQPHPMRLLNFGNHEARASDLSLPEIRKLCGPARFLACDEVVDCFGVRIAGNSYSFGESGNRYGQTPEFLQALKQMDPHKLPIVDGAANTSAPSFAPRKPSQRAIDILMTHSAFPWDTEDGDEILSRLDPVLHAVGHHHERSGLWPGTPRKRKGGPNFTTPLGEDPVSGAAASMASAAAAAADDPARKFEWQLHKTIPQVNGAIVAELHKFHPALHPVKVFDVFPMRS